MLEPGACQSQEFRHSSEIPVRVAHIRVTKVRGKSSDGVINLGSLLIRLDEPAAGEGVPHVVNPWFPTSTVSCPVQLVSQHSKCSPCGSLGKTRTANCHEERIGPCDRMKAIAHPCVITQDSQRGRMQWDETHLAKLRSADGE